MVDRDLGQYYKRLRSVRFLVGRAGIDQHIAGLEKIRKELRKSTRVPCLEGLETAANKAEDAVSQGHAALMKCQRQIQDATSNVGSFELELDEIEQLPQPIQQLVKNRDDLRWTLAGILESTLNELDDCAAAAFNIRDVASYDSGIGIVRRVISKQTSVNIHSLTQSIAAARECAVEYNNTQCRSQCRLVVVAQMGENEVEEEEEEEEEEAATENSKVLAVLQRFDNWYEACTLTRDNAFRESDSAMQKLQQSLTSTCSAVLGLKDDVGVDSLERNFGEAQKALDRERFLQKEDVVSLLPFKSLIRIAATVLEGLKHQATLIDRLVILQQKIVQDLQLCRECIDGSKSQEKEEAIKELLASRDQHDEALESTSTYIHAHTTVTNTQTRSPCILVGVRDFVIENLLFDMLQERKEEREKALRDTLD